MKIQDIITLEKRNLKKVVVNPLYTYYRENTTELNYEKKKGYYWKIPSHSQDEGVLLNNYEKDCVIAYIENKYLIFFLIKIMGKDNFKPFIYLKDFLCSLGNNYEISKCYDNKKIIEAFEDDKENLKIIENEEYKRFVKLVILEGLE